VENELTEQQVKQIVTEVWNCVDYDSEGHAWLDNLKAIAKVSALLRSKQQAERMPLARIVERMERAVGELATAITDEERFCKLCEYRQRSANEKAEAQSHSEDCEFTGLLAILDSLRELVKRG